jgi:mRNA interferase RelE/StbE
VERDLRQLTRAFFERVNERILSLRDDPLPHGVCRLVGTVEGWRIRVGDYSIHCQIDDYTQTLIIVHVKHRREAY